MNPLSLPLILIYSFSLWLGSYLLRRGWDHTGVRFAGLGLIAFDLGLLVAIILPDFDAYPLLAVIPAVCWFLSIRAFMGRTADQEDAAATPHRPRRRRAMITVWVATVFFCGSLVLVTLPQLLNIPWLSIELVLVLMDIDLLLLGWGIAVLYADDQGQALLPDALRSLTAVVLACLIFGGQVALVMQIEGASPGMIFLLYSILSVTILSLVFAPLIQQGLDRFTVSPAAREEREVLRAVYNAIPWRDETLNLLALDEAEFTRLTRRALGLLGDLEGLAGSPLLYLPQVDAVLKDQQIADSTLSRTTALKTLLTCRIEALRPQTGEDFGTTDAWRYYNALYYPYVAGLKPYRISRSDVDFDAPTQSIVQWFREQVPERTLYNWQNKAAQLIARDLREAAQAVQPV